MQTPSEIPGTGFKFLLYSASPRRKQLLIETGSDVDVLPNNTNENYPDHLGGPEIALYLAQKKGDSFTVHPDKNHISITADTIVCLDDHVLGKPADRIDAIRILEKLSGRSHQVFTGVCMKNKEKNICFFSESIVTFLPLSSALIQRYIDQYKPYDKAGSYGAQECLPVEMNPLSDQEKEFLIRIGKPELFQKLLNILPENHLPLIREIKGSYFNVMGLPIVELYENLQHFR